MSKKISEWLKELPMPYREMALDNFKKQDMDDTARPSITSTCIALANAFDWYYSPEGYEYWDDVFDRLVTGDLSASSNGECDIKKQLDEVTKQLDEVTKQRDELTNVLRVAMARAYAAGYQHGHDDSVESRFIIVDQAEAKEHFAEDVKQMLLDGSQPEAAAALASVKGGFPVSYKDYTIAAVAICLVSIFAPKSVALCFIAVAMAAAYWFNRPSK